MTTIATNFFSSAVANGVAPIPFSFQAVSATEVGALRAGVAATDFAVTLNGDGTGSITPNSSWGTDPVIVYSKPDLTQPSDFQRFAPLYPDQITTALDRLAREIIYLKGLIDGSVHAPVGETLLLLPSKLVRAGHLLGFDSNGNPDVSLTAAKGDPGSPGEGYATRTAMAARAAPALFDDVFLTEKGREGKFIVATAASYTAAIAADTRQGVFVPSTADATKVYVRQFNGPLQAEWFGANNDGVTDNLAVGNAIIAFLIATAFNTVTGRRASYNVRWGLGTFFFSDTWDLKGTTFIMEGSTGGQAGGVGTKLKWPADKGGLRLQKSNTEGTGVGSTIPYGNDASILRNLALEGSGGTSATAHGLWARCPFVAENLSIFNFKGNGYNLVGSAGSGGATEGLINGSRVTGGQVSSCGGDGIHIFGADANVLNITSVDCSSNGGYGIYNESFLSNQFNSPHSAGNTLGAYKDTNSNGVWINPYSEGGQPPADMGQTAIILGGTPGAGFVTTSGGYISVLAGGILKLFRTVVTADAEFDNFLKITGSTAFPGGAASNAYIYRSAGNGLVMYGAGTVFDLVLANSTGTSALSIPTGTVDIQLGRHLLLPVGGVVKVNGTQVLTARQGAIASPAGGTTIDTQARTAIDAIRTVLTTHGLTN